MIEPLNNNVYLIEESENQSASGIVFSNEQRKGCIGVIYAIAENELGLKKGDRVIFSRYTAEDVELKDEEGKPIKNLKSCQIDSLSAVFR